MTAQHFENVRFQIRPQLHPTPQGRQSAREALARIHRALGLKEAPSAEELVSWVSHEDERVPLAAVRALFVLLEAPIPWELVSNARRFFHDCVRRAIGDADRAGFLWTPLLDALAQSTPWWIPKYFEHGNHLVLAQGKLAADYLVAHPRAACPELLGAVRWPPIRDAVAAQMPVINERAVRLMLASDDVPPTGMPSHSGLTPDAADAMWDLLRRSYRTRLISFPKEYQQHHEVMDWELAHIGDLLRHGRRSGEPTTPLLNNAYLEDLLVLLELGGLGPGPAAEIALTIIELDRSGDGDLIRQVWRALTRQNLQTFFHYEAAYVHPHYPMIAVEVATDLVRDSDDDWRVLHEMLSRAPMNSDIADCIANASDSYLRMKALPQTSPGVFRRVFAELARGDVLDESAIEDATEAQLAAVRRADWRPLLKSQEPSRDLILARIPNARTTPVGRALLMSSTNPAVLCQLCRSSELSVPECVDLFDRIVALDPQHATLPLKDAAIVHALKVEQLAPLLTHSVPSVRFAAITASATVGTGESAPPRRRARRTRALR
jgi:hypothetical protein